MAVAFRFGSKQAPHQYMKKYETRAIHSRVMADKITSKGTIVPSAGRINGFNPAESLKRRHCS